MSFNPADSSWTRPGGDAVAITPSASEITDGPTRGLYVGVTGNVTVTFIDGSSVEFTNLAAGVIHPLSVTHVTAATATGIVAVF